MICLISAWRAAKMIIKKYEILANDSLDTYFKNICAPGGEDISNFLNNASLDNTICPEEVDQCSPSSSNKDSNCSKLFTTLNRNDLNAFKCLNHFGHVAFVSMKSSEGKLNHKNISFNSRKKHEKFSDDNPNRIQPLDWDTGR